MLRDGDPPCPKLLANHLCELEDVAAALGPAMTPPAPDSPSATGTATDKSLSTSLPPSPPPQRLDERAALRTALLMNVAAAALKLSEWRLARTACEAVLAVEPRHPKAMWRVAKAHEGDNNLSEAINVATKLVRSDASNAEASKLLVHLQKRKAKYGKMFNSFVERAHAEGDTLYTKREHERDVSDAMQKGFIQCMGRPMPGEDEGIPKPPELPEGVYEEVDEHGVVTLRDADGEERKVTDGEMMEVHARHHYEHKKQFTADEKTLNRVMGRAYNQTKSMREAAVKMNLPANVLAGPDYVDP